MARWTPLDPTSVDLTNFDVSQIDVADVLRRSTEHLAGVVSDRAIDLARDAAYVTVGLGLLNFQRLQVRRRELERSLRRYA